MTNKKKLRKPTQAGEASFWFTTGHHNHPSNLHNGSDMMSSNKQLPSITES